MRNIHFAEPLLQRTHDRPASPPTASDDETQQTRMGGLLPSYRETDRLGKPIGAMLNRRDVTFFTHVHCETGTTPDSQALVCSDDRPGHGRTGTQSDYPTVIIGRIFSFDTATILSAMDCRRCGGGRRFWHFAANVTFGA